MSVSDADKLDQLKRANRVIMTLQMFAGDYTRAFPGIPGVDGSVWRGIPASQLRAVAREWVEQWGTQRRQVIDVLRRVDTQRVRPRHLEAAQLKIDEMLRDLVERIEQLRDVA